MSENPSVSPEVQSLKDDVCKKAEQIVLTEFPKKLTMLTNALKGPMFSISDLTQVHSTIHIPVALTNGDTEDQPGTKRRRTASEGDEEYPLQLGIKRPPIFTKEIPCNKHIEDIIDFIKPEIIATIDNCSDIKLWIQLMIPKIEDGNNFGVSIQEDILGEVTKAESDASTYLDQITRYFSSRAKMVSKLAKYPLLQDYRRALEEYDEKVFLSFRLILTELRNIYVVLYDVVLKNYEKLKKPRSTNTSALY